MCRKDSGVDPGSGRLFRKMRANISRRGLRGDIPATDVADNCAIERTGILAKN